MGAANGHGGASTFTVVGGILGCTSAEKTLLKKEKKEKKEKKNQRGDCSKTECTEILSRCGKNAFWQLVTRLNGLHNEKKHTTGTQWKTLEETAKEIV